MDNKRINQRSPIEMAASFGIPEDLPYTQEATIVNVSSGGFGFFTHEPIKAGKDILLCVDLGDDTLATIKVKSAWCKAVGDSGRFMVGVQILEGEGPDYERFLEFYTSLIKSNPPEKTG
ncbi:MAG: PilZ domain-containing protein [Candidatus Omnitrophica bacterium]|nr:PilZ domain-containing protein [Candidatus Omnitrophota bacterium]